MAAYFIAQYVVNDPKLYREYQAAAGRTVQECGGEVVAFDVAAETIEGTPPGPHTVILKFDSMEAARRCFESPEYVAAAAHRRDGGGRNELTIVEAGAGPSPRP